MKKIAARIGTILVAFVLLVGLEISMSRQADKVPRQVYAVGQPTATPETPSVAPTAIPLVEAPTPAVPASTPCPSKDSTVTAHMLACTGHEPPYSLRETIDVYVTNTGTYDSPDWDGCKAGTLGCIAGNQDKWNIHKNSNGSSYTDRAGFYFVENQCVGSEPIDCPVYWPIDQ